MTDTTPDPAPAATPPVPLPPAEVAPADITPATVATATSPYLASPASPYAQAPVQVERPRRNGVGLAALIVLIVSYLVPFGFFLAPVLAGAASSNSDALGWGFLGGFFFFFIGLIPGGILALIALVLAIVSLFLKNRSKVLGIVTICLSAPYVILGLLLLPTALSLNS